MRQQAFHHACSDQQFVAKPSYAVSFSTSDRDKDTRYSGVARHQRDVLPRSATARGPPRIPPTARVRICANARRHRDFLAVCMYIAAAMRAAAHQSCAHTAREKTRHTHGRRRPQRRRRPSFQQRWEVGKWMARGHFRFFFHDVLRFVCVCVTAHRRKSVAKEERGPLAHGGTKESRTGGVVASCGEAHRWTDAWAALTGP